MVIVVLSGGIGAQMFQFATGYALAKKFNCKLVLDACWFNKNNVFATKPFTINNFLNLKNYYFIRNKWISRLLRFFFLLSHYITFGKYNYVRVDLNNPLEFKKISKFKNLFFNGHVQNIDYFKNDVSEILNKIIITEHNNSDQKQLYKIAVHVRKGDQKNGPIDFLNNDYYKNGLKKILDKKKIEYENLQIIIFCEEMEWPKSNLIFDNRIKKIEYVIGDDNSAVIDLQKMINCDSIIMSNSGYSWWAAAYINKKKDGFVVCPDLWWNRIPVNKINIYLDEWIIVQTNISPNLNPEFTA